MRFGVCLLPARGSHGRRRHCLERYDKSRSPVFSVTLGFDDSTVRRDHGFGNGQTEPEAPKTPGDGALTLFERVKNRLDFFRFDADPGVRGPDFNRPG